MRDKIMNTKLFKGLEPFKQKIYSNPKNIKEIEHLYGIAERISFDYMVQSHNPNNTDKLIVKELLNI